MDVMVMPASTRGPARNSLASSRQDGIYAVTTALRSRDGAASRARRLEARHQHQQRVGEAPRLPDRKLDRISFAGHRLDVDRPSLLDPRVDLSVGDRQVIVIMHLVSLQSMTVPAYVRDDASSTTKRTRGCRALRLHARHFFSSSFETAAR